MRKAMGIVGLVMLLAACSVPTESTSGASSTHTASRKSGTASPSPSPSPSSDASPAASQAPQAHFGQVIGLDGQPAANVQVRGFLISNNGGGIVSNNGSGLISDKGGAYRLLADAPLETTTDAQGFFKLVDPQGRAINLEAVKSDTEKAISFAVASTASNVTLQLAHTGSISGKVTASKAPTVTDFTGVDVFVPGTSYTAKTAADGSFVISNVPVGTFALYGAKTGLGTATAADIKVESDKSASATLDLSVTAPTLSSVSPDNAGPGAEVTLKGDHFGATDGSTFSVNMGGAVAAGPTRVDEQTIKFKVPDSATTGDVSVTVNGIQSGTQKLKVLKSLTLPLVMQSMHVGDKAASMAYAHDTKDETLSAAAVSWSIQGTAASLDANNQITAIAPGTATLTATSGTLTKSLTINVYGDGPVISTLAGGDTYDANNVFYAAADGLGLDAHFAGAMTSTCAADGTIYLLDYSGNRLCKVTPAGAVTTLAGGSAGFADGQGAAAKFAYPEGIVLGDDGNLYVTDQSNNRIRKVTPAGAVTTFAGDGTAGHTDATGLQASFTRPTLLARDTAGNMYLAEANVSTVRKVTPAGVVTTLANLTGTGAGTNFSGLAVDSFGNVFLADPHAFCIWKITAGGVVSKFVGSGASGTADGTGTGATFTNPGPLALSAQGALYMVDRLPGSDVSFTTRLCKITSAGVVTTLVTGTLGNVDGPFSQAKMWGLRGLTFDPDGRLLVIDSSDYYDALRRIDGLP